MRLNLEEGSFRLNKKCVAIAYNIFIDSPAVVGWRYRIMDDTSIFIQIMPYSFDSQEYFKENGRPLDIMTYSSANICQKDMCLVVHYANCRVDCCPVFAYIQDNAWNDHLPEHCDRYNGHATINFTE